MPIRERGKLLLVEDERVLRTLVAQYLRGERFRIVEASDGPEGVAEFEASGPFDLVLLDINLPGFSGVEVCRRIKARNPLQKVMICSAAVMPDHELALLDLGVERWLTKPYHPEELVHNILEELAAHRPAVAPTRQPA